MNIKFYIRVVGHVEGKVEFLYLVPTLGYTYDVRNYASEINEFDKYEQAEEYLRVFIENTGYNLLNKHFTIEKHYVSE